MIAVLAAIYEFLITVLPLLTAIGAALIETLRFIYEAAKITAVLTLLVALLDILFDPKGKQRVGNLLANLVGGAIAVAQPLLVAGETELAAIVHAFASSMKSTGPALAGAVGTDIQDFVKTNLDAVAKQLGSIGESTAANAVGTAGIAFGEAFGLGLGSAAVTAAFEALLPEKLNTLNGIGPMLAEMAGFKEVAGNVLEPLYENAFGRSLQYLYRAQFKPELPSEDDAVTWHSRRLLSDAQLRTIFGFSGLKAEYETPYVASAYRAIQPRAIATLIQDSPFPTAQIRSALEFAGIRPQDVDFMLPALEWNSTRNVRQEYLTAAVRSTELGTLTPQELDQVLDSIGYSTQAKTWVQLTVSTRKLEQLAQLYRRSVSEEYKYGTITDAQYVPLLQAIGINHADAEAHFRLDQATKQGKDFVAAQRAAARLAAQRERAEVKTAVEGYRQHQYDAGVLEAALLAAGVDLVVATWQVEYEVLRREQSKVFIYGLELTREQALVLRENVAALKAQTTAGLFTAAQAEAALLAYNIPPVHAQALIADWEASTKHKPQDATPLQR